MSNTARYVPFAEREGGEAWARIEEALGRYFDAEEQALIAAARMARGVSPVEQLGGRNG